MMRALSCHLLLVAATLTVAADPAPRARRPEWAAPVAGTTLGNFFRVSDELYRCEQPRARDIPSLKKTGIRSIVNLRRYHGEPTALKRAGFQLFVQRTEAGYLTVDDLVAALRLIRAAPKPVLVHCWRGSDRTGTVVAAYRIAFQGWTREAAIDEFRHGGFGYHEKRLPNLMRLLGGIDEDDLRRRVNE